MFHRIGCFLAACVVLCPGVAAQNELDACGQLIQGVECVLFQTDDGERYLLDDRDDFRVGDRIRVRGTIDPDCVTICLQGDGCVEVDSIGYCDGAVSLCGTLVQGAECVLFEDAGGRRFVLDEQGDFEVGDLVFVNGSLDSDCSSICIEQDGCIRNNTIRAAGNDDDCPRTNPPICALASSLGMALLLVGLVRVTRRAPSSR